MDRNGFPSQVQRRMLLKRRAETQLSLCFDALPMQSTGLVDHEVDEVADFEVQGTETELETRLSP